MILKFFSDKSYLPEKERYIVLLYPFWGLLPEPEGNKDAGRFDEYSRVGSKLFNLSPSLEKADVAVLPFGWRAKDQWGTDYNRYSELAYKLAGEAKKHGKRIVISFNSDSDEAVPLDNSIVLRTSLYRTTRKHNEFAIPGWSVDFLSRYLGGKLQIRKKNHIPSVGYCGYVDYNPENKIKSLLLHSMKVITGRSQTGARLRGLAVRTLMYDKRVNMNFIFRKGFSGNGNDSIRRDYVKNIVESDYALVVRGGGNFSYRLYEVLSCGRIPVFVDTDCVLPFDHIIDWKKYCVWVDSKDIESIGDKIVAFHNNITDGDFEGLQRSIRRLYEEWISPVGFHKNLWRCII